ncbi:siderophore-interacting protein [Arthrobacter sp. NPDC090010]|uniref:siderophore-interacting protein n=1 Tax=Arthrobacter sp. NPDC090010 TaxID=3363942 RepID=UPI003819205A
MTRSGSPGRPWAYSAFPVVVARKTRLSPGFIRITFSGASLRHFAPWGLDQRIKLVLPMPDGTRPDFGLLEEPTPHPQQWYARWKTLPEQCRNVLRTYTPAAVRPEDCEIDVDLFIHQPAGPASLWAESCPIGEELVITGPDIRVGHTGYGIHYAPPAPPTRVLLIGDETALPAISNILARTPDTVPAEVFLELADPRDNTLPPLSPAARLHLIDRAGPPGAGLDQAVREWGARHGGTLVEVPGTYAWIAGEAKTTTQIRRHLSTTLALPKEQIAFLGYWRLGGPLVG